MPGDLYVIAVYEMFSVSNILKSVLLQCFFMVVLMKECIVAGKCHGYCGASGVIAKCNMPAMI